jgi:diguanylate cyclase (GGDEF)-like protein
VAPLPDTTTVPTERHGLRPWVVGVLGIGIIGAFDYYSGVELRVFPLYYAPIALLAWHSGRSGALIGTALCGATWLVANVLAGLRFSHTSIGVANTLMQAASFATVGLLIATVKTALLRERQLSRTDPLTSMLNSRAFYEEAMRILAVCRRAARPVTVAYIDLDNFKAVNDRLGHQAGDDLLRAVAAVLGAPIRPGDVAGRLGGDEFVVLFPETGPREAAITLERLRSSLAEALASGPCPATGSIGGVTFLTVPEHARDIVQQSDFQMYAAKAAGGNRVNLVVVGQPPTQRAHAP